MGQIEPDTRKRKFTDADRQALEARARAIGQIGAPREPDKIKAQADAAYQLALDFWGVGLLGSDFPRWLAKHSGMSRSTCRRRLTQGRFRYQDRRNRNGSGMVAEQRERETTPRPDLKHDEG